MGLVRGSSVVRNLHLSITAGRLLLHRSGGLAAAQLVHYTSAQVALPLAKQRQLHAPAAAQAPEGGYRLLGSHLITGCVASQAGWFAETWYMKDVRMAWPRLSKPAQGCIACVESLAQLALLQATHSHICGGPALRHC